MRLLSKRFFIGVIAGGLALAGCAAETGAGAGSKGDTGAVSGGKEDRWNSGNAPDRFDGELNFNVADLPLSGRAENDAWPSTYWPTYEDAINHRWHGEELSPAEKYDQAFNGWTPPEGFASLRPFSRHAPVPNTDWDPSYYDQLGPLASHVSANMGNKRDRDLAVSSNGRPADGEWPVETWWGLCHAWVPAAMLEERPLRSVEHNGVTFHVGDMEALLIAAYNRTPAQMIGGRCNRGGSDEDYQVERDEHGRAINDECRDTNPGSLHVIMTNYLGLMNRAFAEDRTYDYEVWNQPVVEYEITKMDEISVEQANMLLGLTGETYTYNADAAKLYDVNATFTYVTESHASTEPSDTASHERTDRYTYILEVDSDGKIIGGEWYGGSRSSHPDFLWNPQRLSRSSVSQIDLDKIRMLVQMSRETVTPPGPGGGNEYASTTGGPIPDNDPAGLTSVINVPDSVDLAGVQVELDITHSYRGDLQVVLQHGETERVIHNREGGSSDDLQTTITVPGFSGDAQGEWRLIVRDLANLDTGALNGWKLILTGEGGGGGGGGGTTSGRYPGEGGLAIPDNDATGIRSNATVPAGTTGSAVQVAVNLTHTYVGDLVLALEGPGGTSWTLQDQTGGSADDINTSFPLSPAPSGDLGGTWTLTVSDNAGADVGTLNSWSLVVSE